MERKDRYAGYEENINSQDDAVSHLGTGTRVPCHVACDQPPRQNCVEELTRAASAAKVPSSVNLTKELNTRLCTSLI